MEEVLNLPAKPCVYILLCANGQFYVGATEDMQERLHRHQLGWGCGFTHSHLPVKLVYTEEFPTYQQAFKRERQLHGWSHAKKEALIKGDYDLLRELSKNKK